MSNGSTLTYMHINNLSIPLFPAHNRSDDNKLVISNEIPYASLIFGSRVATIGGEVEFEGGTALDEEEEKDYHRGERPPAHR